MKTISYAILVHNELEEIERLLTLLEDNIKPLDEIIVVVDDTKYYEKVVDVLKQFKRVKYYKHKLNNDFAAQKNFLNSKCTKDYIVNLDADELLGVEFLLNLNNIIEANETDAFILPRINTIDVDLSDKIIKAWNWTLNDKKWINYPDWQMRIYRNTPDIMWKGNVHETLDGYSTYSKLPTSEEYSILHKKSFNVQFRQNCYYNFIDVINRLKELKLFFDVKENTINLETNNEKYIINYYKWLHPYQGEWELDSLFTKDYMEFLEQFISPNDVVLDIGAQVGNMSVAYSNIVGDGGKVIAFEPNPATYNVLKINSDINQNIYPHNYAITNEYSVETFHYSDNGLCNGGFASNTERGIGVTNHNIPINVYTINLCNFLNDNYKDDINKIKFIKIDAEGYDRFIIPQLKPLLDNKPTILTEIYNGLTQNEVRDLLLQIDKIGYIAYDEMSFKNGNKKVIKSMQDIDIQSGHNLLCLPKYV